MYKHCKQEVKSLFALRLKNERNRAELTQAAIAQSVNVSLRVYQNYESYKSPNMPTFATLIKIVRILNVSADYLLGQTNQRGVLNYTL